MSKNNLREFFTLEINDLTDDWVFLCNNCIKMGTTDVISKKEVIECVVNKLLSEAKNIKDYNANNNR